MANMLQLIEEIWFLNRDLVSEGYDRALARLAAELPMTIHEVPTGAKVWTWTVPEAWSCHEAYLETLGGKRLIDVADHPLHVISYSLPFEGEVSRAELLQHLHVHPHLPDAIPYVFKVYQRDWGLCATQTLRDSLKDKRYRVVIRTQFTPGTLKIGEVLVSGESDECFVIAAHLDHPAMVNDDLSGVVVGLEAARRLLAGPKPYYSYRFLFLPETLGSIAYLSQHEHLIPKMLAGLFLEMLGNDAPHALQTSFQVDSPADTCLVAALRGAEPEAYVGAYRTVINNDERQFNAPGVRVPMLSLSRVVDPYLPASRYYPYRQYHSSLDTPAIISADCLEKSVQLVLELLSAFDRNRYIVNRFKGEIFASGYGLWVDYKADAAAHKSRFDVMDRCDGTHRPAEIALELGLSFQEVWSLIEKMLEKDLVYLSSGAQPTDPHLV
jgi:aminopeptidase-like protein